MIVIRYADDTIAGFAHSQDAERFLFERSTRLAQFGLGLHSDKTRLIEFGRQARAGRRVRRLGKPQTFDFLGFTHCCGTRRNGSGGVAWKDSDAQKNASKVEGDKGTRHDGLEAQGKWLGQVLRGWLAYSAVPMSAPAIAAFRHRLAVSSRIVVV